MATKDELIESIKTLTVLELSELVKALEEEFGVSASAPVAIQEAVGKDVAAETKKKLEDAGASVTVA
jgi:large subunit ribosomal protein L7/L12